MIGEPKMYVQAYIKLKILGVISIHMIYELPDRLKF